MPLKHLLKNALPIPLNHIPMTRNDPVKIPLIDPPRTLVEARSIPTAQRIPLEPLLSQGLALRALEQLEQLRQNALIRSLPGPRVLLRRRRVEHIIRHNERLLRLVQEHQLLVGMVGDELVLEVPVELLGYANAPAVLRREDGVEGDLLAVGGRRGIVGALGALLGEALGADDDGLGEGLGPGADEDVVLDVGRDDVFQVVALLLELGLHFGCQSYGREDGEGTGGEADWVMLAGASGELGGIGREERRGRREWKMTYQLYHVRPYERFHSGRREQRGL